MSVLLFVKQTVDVALCPQCQRGSTNIHDTGEPQMIRDLSIWNRRFWLQLLPRQFKCASCKNTYSIISDKVRKSACVNKVHAHLFLRTTAPTRDRL